MSGSTREQDSYLKIISSNKNELFPFMKEAFARSLDSSQIFEIDDILPGDEKLKKLRRETVESQKRLDLGLYVDEKLVGSFMGRSSEKGIFRMGTSVLLPEYQGRGYYSQLLDYVVDWCSEKGFWAIESCHNPCNRKIIAIKLNKGFYISGTETSVEIGNKIKMTHFLKPEMEEVFLYRNGFKNASLRIQSLIQSETQDD